MSHIVIEIDDLFPEAYPTTDASLNHIHCILISLDSLCPRLSAEFTLHYTENKLMTLCLPSEYSPITLIFHFPLIKIYVFCFIRLSRGHSFFIPFIPVVLN